MINRIDCFVIVFAISVLVACGGAENDFVRVRRGPFKATLTESGELQARQSKVITMPSYSWQYGRPKLVELVEEGIEVEAGDTVGQLETTGVERVLNEKKADLEIAIADRNKLLVNQQNALSDLYAQVNSSKAALEMARIDLERVIYESEHRQQIARLHLRIAEIGFARAQAKLEHTKGIHEEELHVQDLKIQQIQAAISEAERTLERFVLRAPSDGMVEYHRHRGRRGVGDKIQVGDEFWPGQGLVGLPNLQHMTVFTAVDETDIKHVAEGQRARIRLDAYPKIEFTGSLTDVGMICHPLEQESRKVFDVQIDIHESDPLLKPGMTVRCEIETASIDDTLFVSPAAIHETVDGYVVYCQNGASWDKVPVSLGPRNQHSVVIHGNVKQGDHLRLSKED
jgi:multidrug efflux pump subunit AcrA (membrane-fusion protein)